MIIFLLELLVLLLFSGKGKTNLILSFGFYLFFCIFFLFIQRKKSCKFSFEIKYPLGTLIICLLAVAAFYLRWNTSGRIISFAAIPSKGVKQPCIFIAFLLAALTAFGIDYAVQLILSFFSKRNLPGENSFSEIADSFYIILTSFLVITQNSTCSPLYPINRWADPNTTITVGKAALNLSPSSRYIRTNTPAFLLMNMPDGLSVRQIQATVIPTGIPVNNKTLFS